MMKKITFLLLLLPLLTLNAQWTEQTDQNTLVSSIVTDDMQALAATQGKTFVVFWKSVDEPVNYELRVQLLDTQGNALFGEEGKLISNTIPMSSYTSMWKIAVDANDNLYVGVTGTGEGTPTSVFKVNSAGNNLWGTEGLALGSGYLPTILPLSNGNVLISHWPGSGKAKLQLYNSEGTAIWDTPVNIIGGGANAATIPADLYPMADGGSIVVFHQKGSFGVGSTLYAQRYNNSGVSQWTSPVQLSNKGTFYNANYGGGADGDTVFYGYTGSTGNRFDGFVQRINSDGTLPWGINGKDFDTNTTSYEMDTRIAVSENSSYVWAIARYTPTSQDLYGEYVQKFDKATGAVQFTDNAKEVFPIDNMYRNHLGKLHLVNDQPLFLIKSGLDNGSSPITLSAVLLDENGDFGFESETIPVATFAANKSDVALTTPYNGGAVAVFLENKGTGSLPYAQRFFDVALLSNGSFTRSDNFAVYPNPSRGPVTIAIDSEFVGSKVNVYNLVGQKITTADLTLTETTLNLDKGFYILEVSGNGKMSSKKIIVQ